MYLTLVKFEDSEKKYLFSADKRYEVGDKVVCDTCRGEQVGCVVLQNYLNENEDLFNRAFECEVIMAENLLFEATGATLPLKKILRKKGKGAPRIQKINSVEELEEAHEEFRHYCNSHYNCARCKYGNTPYKVDGCFVKFLIDEVAE